MRESRETRRESQRRLRRRARSAARSRLKARSRVSRDVAAKRDCIAGFFIFEWSKLAMSSHINSMWISGSLWFENGRVIEKNRPDQESLILFLFLLAYIHGKTGVYSSL